MMRKVAIVTDSSANLPADLIKRHHITVVPLQVYIDGHAYRDGLDLTPAALYEYMSKNRDGNLPTTSTPSTDEFVRAFTRAGEEAEEVVPILVSAKLSATYQVACLARSLVDVPVHVLDSRNAAMGCGFAVLEAARLAQEGAGVNEVIQRAKTVSQSARFLLALEKLDYLQRGGRVPAIAALATSALKISPIVNIDNGMVKIAGIGRTRNGALRRILQQFERDVAGRPVHVAVTHAGVPEEAEQFLAEITQRFTCVEAFITELTPVMGTHTGPGLLGVAYFAEL